MAASTNNASNLQPARAPLPVKATTFPLRPPRLATPSVWRQSSQATTATHRSGGSSWRRSGQVATLLIQSESVERSLLRPVVMAKVVGVAARRKRSEVTPLPKVARQLQHSGEQRHEARLVVDGDLRALVVGARVEVAVVNVGAADERARHDLQRSSRYEEIRVVCA